jgi:hypothetical protein
MFFNKFIKVFIVVVFLISIGYGQTTQNQPEWEIKVKSLVADNCPATGCTCLMGGPPHHGVCKAVGVMQITEGHYGNVKLDGQNFGITTKFTSLSDMEYLSYYIDKNSPPEVKKALLELLSNSPFGIIGEGFEIKETSLKFSMKEGKAATFSLGEYGEMTLTPMMGGDGKTEMSVTNPTYPFPVKEIFLSSAKGYYNDYGTELKLENNSGEVGEFVLKGGGM